ncbi:TPA: 5,10-methylenetetrahydrofolate reductase [Candidatus Poribacteria bacterium]|nr:5,10-methylenetetrahydrofolate reductase [Candidatus Poribacteria bacterium]
MVVTEQKPIEEIVESLGDEKDVFIVNCSGCPEGLETGGEDEVLKIKSELENAGKAVVDWIAIDFLCNKELVATRLIRKIDSLQKADSLLVVSCGIGVQAVAAIVDKVTRPALNTVSLGGIQGKWRSEERCQECGDCYLAYTGGICPITSCTKSLLNGACGGYKDDRCEIDPEKDCGWMLIYQRLKNLDRLDLLKQARKLRNFNNMMPSAELRQESFWDIEQETAK